MSTYKWLFLGLTLVILSADYSYAQANDYSNFSLKAEKIKIVTDRQLYIAGETIWFALCISDQEQGELSDFSKIAYVELIGSTGLVMSRVKVELNNGTGNGSMDLSKDLNSGNYQLRSYTQAMRNYGEDIFEKHPVIVLHPDQQIVTTKGRDHAIAANQKHQDNNADIVVSVKLNKEVYDQRGRVQLDIEAKDHNAQPVSTDLSVSVTLGSATFRLADLDTPKAEDQTPTKTYASETIGMHLSGQVLSTSTEEGIPDVKVYLAFPGEKALVYSALTDDKGRFRFILPKLYGPKEVVVQVEQKYEDQAKIEIDDEYHESSISAGELFMLEEQWLPFANALLENASIAKAYTAFKEQPVYKQDSTFFNFPFYGTYDKQYVLDDYTRFPLPEFYFEIVSEVRVLGKFGSERLKVANTWSLPNREVPPLLLVDGVPVFDNDKFLKINNKLISSTQIIMEPFWLNTSIFDGIIEVTSFEKDARSFDLPESSIRKGILTLLPERLFDAISYSEVKEETIPDFRNTLYWNPVVRTDNEGKASITFYTSDAIGDYIIDIRAKNVKANSESVNQLSVVKKVN